MVSLVDSIALDQNPWWIQAAARSVRHLMARRDLFGRLYTAILDPQQSRAQVLLGPRQVGKSTLLFQMVDALLDAGVPTGNITFFDFSDDRMPAHSLSPRAVTALTPPGCRADMPRYFLFDEITWAATGWDRWLKQAVDGSRRAATKAATRFVLSSSSASLLRDASLESGQGRWDHHFMEGMTFAEYQRLAQARDPELVLRYLRAGGYPGQLWQGDAALERKRLREDITDRAILHDLLGHDVDVARVKALFTYLVQMSGSQWDARNRARDLAADPRTVGQWLRLLEQTGLVTILPRWTSGTTGNPGRASSELRVHPKIYASDHGLVLAFAAALEDPQIQARIFETVVYRHLREIRDEGTQIAYFRVNEDVEVDFVVSVDGDLTGVEVTSSKVVPGRKVAKILAARAQLRPRRVLMVHGGLFEEERQGIKLVPLHRFLTDPRAAVVGVRTQ